MYFYKKKGRQMLDLRGNLILSHNPSLVRGRIKSAAPAGVRNAVYIDNIPRLPFIRKVRASWAALTFIWGRSQELTGPTIDSEGL
jgi:hypothetical protein